MHALYFLSVCIEHAPTAESTNCCCWQTTCVCSAPVRSHIWILCSRAMHCANSISARHFQRMTTSQMLASASRCAFLTPEKKNEFYGTHQNMGLHHASNTLDLSYCSYRIYHSALYIFVISLLSE